MSTSNRKRKGSAASLSKVSVSARGSISMTVADTAAAAPNTAESSNTTPRASMDLSTLPTDYLEAYPYPAFVLCVPIPPDTEADDGDELTSTSANPLVPFTRTSDPQFEPFSPVWSNAKWHNLVQDRSLLECVDIETARSLGDWLSGAKASSTTKRLQTHSAQRSPITRATSSSTRPRLSHLTTTRYNENGREENVSPISPIGGEEPPEGFWEPDVPYEDRSARSHSQSSSDTGATGLGSGEGAFPGPQSLTMELRQPGRVTLELTKTSLPIWQLSFPSTRTRMSTHSFVIITTTPRSAFVPTNITDTKGITREDPREFYATHRPPSDPLETVGRHMIASAVPRTTVLAANDDDVKPTFREGPVRRMIESERTKSNESTPPDEGKRLELPVSSSEASRHIHFSRNGVVTQSKPMLPTGGEVNGLSLDVNVLLQSTDWSKTSLGPKDSWPQSLKTIVSLVMQYPHQCCLWWGKDLTLIYNAPYAETIFKHPHLFGMSGPTAWAEIWHSLGPLSELVLSGTPVSKEDDLLLFKQLPQQGDGIIEVYHSWMWVPVLQEDGTFGGLWNATINTTDKVLAERRLATVREMGERTAIARTIQEYDSAVLDILATNPRDVPFAALYHVSMPTGDKNSSSTNSGVAASGLSAATAGPVTVKLQLAGSVGVPDDHPSTPKQLSVTLRRQSRDARHSAVAAAFSHAINSSPSPSIISGASNQQNSKTADGESEADMPSPLEHWPFMEALQNKRPVLVEDCSALLENFPVRVWDELPNAAIVVPVSTESDDGIPSSVVVLGLSIRRPFDDDYEAFVHMLRLQLASGITAVKSYEAERQRIEELAALDRAKSLLFSNVSHELRTPLTLVAGPLDDLLAEAPEGPRKEMLIMARRNVRRLTRLVSTLMDVSRLEAGRLKGSFRLVNLGRMTRDLAGLFRGAVERHRLKYIVEVDLSPQPAFVDPEHWEKIVFNLVGNALKYTMQGFVHVALQYGPGEAILAVHDSGVGIPASDKDLVGERFHRVQSVSRSHEGTGIGLNLIKELIKLHGGVLEVDSRTAEESEDGSHGSTFRVRIPLGSDHLPKESIEFDPSPTVRHVGYGEAMVDETMQWSKERESSSIDSSSDSGNGGGTSTGDSSAKSSRGFDASTLYFAKEDVILLVDDSFDVRRYMRSIFAPYCAIMEARDGKEALELCEKQQPDLIISDVMMPNLDGFGLLAALKSSKELRMTPIIMLTARGGDENKVDGLLAGADDYLEKPFNARELIARAHMQVQLGKKRRHLEEAFDERTAELRTLSEFSPVGIFRCAEDGTVTFANSAWYEMSGYPPGEPVHNWGDYIHVEFRREVQQFLERVYMTTEPTQTGEWRFANGRWVTTKIIRLEMAAPGLKGILGCVTDITDRKMHEEAQRLRVIEAEQRRIEAEEAKRQQELLIDITSHEIRNPISSLMQCSSLVKTNLLSLQEQLEITMAKKEAFTPTRQLLTTINEDLEALESIYQCGLAQERISNDVLSLGRIQLDMLQMFDVDTNIRDEGHKVISIFQNEARMRRIALSFVVGESVERLGVDSIKTDNVRLGQVVTNLLSNGIRFTSTSQIRKIELRFDLSFEPPVDSSCLMPRVPEKPTVLKDDMPVYLYVAVKDTGPGLTDKELEMLFQRFSQVSPKTHTIFGGSGLGLFVCRKITELMGGRIEVVSEYGKGSTFRFFIEARTTQTSLAKRAKAKGGGLAPGRPPLKKRNTGKLGVAGPKPHVLIVEDNLINQTVLARQLKHVGLTCDVANNGLEALEKIRKVSSAISSPDGQPFDCVIMDLEMPVMDGLTAVRHIREEENAGLLIKNLVIALTGNARQGQIDEAKRSGMDEVVIKPYRLDHLLQKIEDMMKLRASSSPPTTSVSPAPPKGDEMQVDGP